MSNFAVSWAQKKRIATEGIFIYETKIEANANILKFVWRKSVEKFNACLMEKTRQIYDELLGKNIIQPLNGIMRTKSRGEILFNRETIGRKSRGMELKIRVKIR
ncbi:hypothetical protein CEF21_09970 [Bacillus sp. FJAT-42376]|nr:hypothetical protein CEF21_09970 [Bacillus sp. FJAT-42376]